MLSADIHYALKRAKLVAETDPLTGLYNLRAFTMIVNRAFDQAVRYSHPLSLIMMDSDNLKGVNDSYGHEAGNRLLKQLATCVQGQLRSSDIFARYGGDEFVVLLPETGTQGARDFAERIRRTVEARGFEISEQTIQTTVSLGVATYPDDGADLAILLDKADKAMYRSQQGGRNRATHVGKEHPMLPRQAPALATSAYAD